MLIQAYYRHCYPQMSPEVRTCTVREPTTSRLRYGVRDRYTKRALTLSDGHHRFDWLKFRIRLPSIQQTRCANRARSTSIFPCENADTRANWKGQTSATKTHFHRPLVPSNHKGELCACVRSHNILDQPTCCSFYIDLLHAP